MLEQVYTDLNQQHQMKPGQVILLLSIFASATYSWLRGDCERGLFSTPSEANKQASWWIKATQDVVDIAHRTSNVSIEGVQGILLGFIVSTIPLMQTGQTQPKQKWAGEHGGICVQVNGKH
ncbi:MAG: hypothetical protein Q9157_001074 [Trypethelium eluteriae]